ncbi:transposase, partial [Serratia ficaria]|uniref:transposase n=1 Tax=Serratia ficaria TaxID=61651 RepID=UPI0021C70C14
MKPLASTVRNVEWDELPARARDIPFAFNPFADGVLMAHQVECLKFDVSILAIPKGRRTGITFAWGLNSTLIAGAQKAAGGDNVYYIGDTKEKGLEFIGYVAKFARVIAAQQSESVSSIEEFLFEDQDDKGNTRQITAYRVRFASGFQVAALSSRPANIRGLQGVVIIDEAAFHQDVQGVLDAATALLIWGGRIVIISSHNGKNNAFNQLCTDIEAGRYGKDAAVFTVTFDDAVANGLYERSCAMKGEVATIEGKEAWYNRIRNAYGPRKAAMREELDAIPRDGNGVCIPGVWIPPCQDSCRLELKNFRGPETTKMNTYSPERKAALIARMMPPHNQSVVQLARSEGIPANTLYAWRTQAGVGAAESL